MRAVIVGLGVIGKVHAEVCKDLNINVVGLCDVNIDSAEKFKHHYFSQAQIFTDYRVMLREIKPDVVHICTPHHLHSEMIIECLKRDINVLCEKPLCINKEQLTDILKAEIKSKAQLGVCLQNRYNSANAVAKEYISNRKAVNAFGTVLWNRDKSYYNGADWRGKWQTEGGGVIINQALHTLDLLQWFMGMPSTCTATISNLTLSDTIDVEDTAVGIFSGDSNFTIFACNGSAKDYPVEINLITDSGYVKISPNGININGEMRVFNDGNKVLGKGCYGSGHLALIADFYNCIEKDKPFNINGVEAAKVMKLIFAMYSSNGQIVKIK